MNHTPTPWEVFDTSVGVGVTARSGDVAWTHNKEAGLWNSQREHDQILANAKLIAAAPDLLGACLAAEKWLAGWASAEPYISVIRAAIAKATEASEACEP